MSKQIHYEERIGVLEAERREKDQEIGRLRIQLESFQVCNIAKGHAGLFKNKNNDSLLRFGGFNNFKYNTHAKSFRPNVMQYRIFI